MRAGMFIEALAEVYRVWLLVVPVFGRRTATSDALVQRCCEREIVVAPQPQTRSLAGITRRIDTRPALLRLFGNQARACAKAVGDQRFDAIHAFRLYTAPLAISLANAAPPSRHPRLDLDLDDIESSTHSRLSELYSMNGRSQEAAREAAEAMRYAKTERRLLHDFDRVYVCSQRDAHQIEWHTRGDVRVAPNAIRPPGSPVQSLTTHPFTFLFVGTLSYYPNEDAVLYFCREVLPRLRAGARAPFRIRIVGTGLPPTFRFLSRLEEVRLIGEVADVGTEYADADAIIVPIRGAGGTRIKVLEAFAYRRPVVATTIGVEGINVSPDRHCLLGDTPGVFAAQCLRLMGDRALGGELAEKAYGLVTTHYSPESVRQAIIGPA